MPSEPRFLRHQERGILLLLYVDDVGLAARSVDWFKKRFGKVFKIKFLGEMKKILGIKITRDRRLQKKIEWRWTESEELAFQVLKKCFSVLDMFGIDPGRPVDAYT